MEVVTILVLLVLNIALPTLDTFTDINLVYKLYRGAHECEYRSYYHPEHDDYNKCYENPVSYCSTAGKNQTVCRFSTKYEMATALLTPFLLNYFVCFITFFRKEKYKKFTFIFALLNIYPQFGNNNQ